MPTGLPPRRHRHFELFPAKWNPIREKRPRQSKNNDRDSVRNEGLLNGAVMHLAMAPIAVLFFSTLVRGDTISVESLFRTLLLGAEAIAEAELGLGQGWIVGNI
jgi:hypothetical protein